MMWVIQSRSPLCQFRAIVAPSMPNFLDASSYRTFGPVAIYFLGTITAFLGRGAERLAQNFDARRHKMASIIWAIIVIVFILWLLGFIIGTAGSFIHLLLVVALILIIYNLLTGRRAV